MEQRQIVKQMIEFSQTTFNNAYSANTLLQDQIERVTNTMLDQAAWIPPEGRKLIDSWAITLKTNRDGFKKYIDESYKHAQDILAG